MLKRPLIELAAVVAVIALASGLTWWQTDTYWQNRWLERDAADLGAMLANAQKNAATEHDWQRQYAAAAATHQQQLEKINHDKDSDLAGYRAGIKQLRQSLSCAAERMPDAPTPAGVRNAASACGLSAADVEFLIRYAARANEVSAQLREAQSLLRAIYANPPLVLHQLQN